VDEVPVIKLARAEAKSFCHEGSSKHEMGRASACETAAVTAAGRAAVTAAGGAAALSAIATPGGAKAAAIIVATVAFIYLALAVRVVAGRAVRDPVSRIAAHLCPLWSLK